MIKDITGKRFGKLVAVSRIEDKTTPSGNCRAMWHCKCDCGNEKDISYNSLVYDKTQSCGCISKEKIKIIGKNNKKYNKYIFYGDMGLCYTDDYRYCWIFDSEDYEKLVDYYWHSNGKDYGMAKISNGKNIYMHRLLMGCDNPLIEIDHINHNRYDNRKNNLRELTPSENQHNKQLNKNNRIGITGIGYSNRDRRYISTVIKNRIKHTKYCKTIQEALAWRKNKSIELYDDKSPYYVGENINEKAN